MDAFYGISLNSDSFRAVYNCANLVELEKCCNLYLYENLPAKSGAIEKERERETSTMWVSYYTNILQVWQHSRNISAENGRSPRSQRPRGDRRNQGLVHHVDLLGGVELGNYFGGE